MRKQLNEKIVNVLNFAPLLKPHGKIIFKTEPYKRVDWGDWTFENYHSSPSVKCGFVIISYPKKAWLNEQPVAWINGKWHRVLQIKILKEYSQLVYGEVVK